MLFFEARDIILVVSVDYSRVFEALFYGELAETSDAIELPDCD